MVASGSQLPAAGRGDTAALPSRVFVIPTYCIRTHGASCERCTQVCPVGALSFAADGAAPAVDQDACTRCGLCVGACDAFSMPRLPLENVLAQVQRAATSGELAVLTCEEHATNDADAAHNHAIVVPCLGALSAEFWCAALASGASVAAAVDFPQCEECERAGAAGMEALSRAVERAEEWSGRALGFAEGQPQEPSLIESLASSDATGRRDVLAQVVAEASDIASGRRRLRTSEALQQFYDRRERMRAQTARMQREGLRFEGFGAPTRPRKTVWPTRKLLLAAIEKDPSIAPRVDVHVAAIDDTRCMGEGACANACPTGAIEPPHADGTTAPARIDARCCIGCELCESACPHQAIAMHATTAEVFVPQHTPDAQEACTS